MFVFLPILLRFKLSGVRNNCCRMMYECGNSPALTRLTVTRYIGTHSVHCHSLGTLSLTRFTDTHSVVTHSVLCHSLGSLTLTLYGHSLGTLSLTRFTDTHSVHCHSVHWYSLGSLAFTLYTINHSVHWYSLCTLSLTRYTGTRYTDTHSVHWHSLGTLALTRYTHSLGTQALTRYTGTHSVHWHSAWPPRADVGLWKNVLALLPPPAREYRLEIFTLNRKDWPSVAECLWLGLKGLNCTVDRQWHRRERHKTCATELGTGNLYRLPPACARVVWLFQVTHNSKFYSDAPLCACYSKWKCSNTNTTLQYLSNNAACFGTTYRHHPLI